MDRESLRENPNSGLCRIEKWSWLTFRYHFCGTGFLYQSNSRIMTSTHVIPDTIYGLRDYRVVFTNGIDEIREFSPSHVIAGGVIIDEIPQNFRNTPGHYDAPVDALTCFLKSAVNRYVFQPILTMDMMLNQDRRCANFTPTKVLHYPSERSLVESKVVDHAFPQNNRLFFIYEATPVTEDGSSGAPILCEDNRVFGINFAGQFPDGNCSLGVPITNVHVLQSVQQAHIEEVENFLRPKSTRLARKSSR